MGRYDQKQIKLVISHLEGCAGNFLGRLASNSFPVNQQFFRVDHNLNDTVLAINGRQTWHEELTRIKDHRVVVTHNFDQNLIKETFPEAKIIQVYPYTHVGNVLYNVCYKKLDIKLKNVVDNHLIDLNIWSELIQRRRPQVECVNYWSLRDMQVIENLLGSQLTLSQKNFFNRYWDTQLSLELNIPQTPMTIAELINLWNIGDRYNDWLIAWVIFVFEHINKLDESQRLWSINNIGQYKSWDQLQMIESSYNI